MELKPKILIVDDEQIIRDTLEGLLALEDVELLLAENGEEGLALARQFQPDAILLDVMMPGMDGFETCRQIRATPALSEVPIIMVTALDDRDSRLTGLRAGADDFLTKPFDGIEIQIRLKNIMRLNRYRNLVAERSRFFWVVENDDKAYLLLDSDGNIQYANQRAQEYFHLPEAYKNINFAHQAERFYQSHLPTDEQVSPENGSNTTYLVQPETITSRAFWLRIEELDTNMAPENQRLVRVSDISDQVVARQDVRKFHSIVGHKLRTPVAHIYTGMALLDDVDSLSLEEIIPLVAVAKHGTQRLIDEVRDILQFIDTPISLDRNDPVLVADLTRLVVDAGKTLELSEISTTIPESLSYNRLAISAAALELVIFEILENSKKFHPTHSPQIELLVQAQGETSIQLQFMDNGQTMTAEQIAQAKLPYTQGEKWFTGEIPGMGLGIPLLSSLIWQAGGQVRIVNRPNTPGICVCLMLPVVP